MNRILLFISLFMSGQILAQTTTVSFEEFSLSAESYTNDAGASGVFESEDVQFPNDYNSEWDSFSHWAISTMTDNETPGFGNQFSSITGGGENSSTYGVCYAPSGSVIRFTEPTVPASMSVTNGAYPYFSMLDGDMFAKRFGGESGDDPDYFRLTIKSYFDGELTSDSMVVNLADYTFEDNSQDYILDSWLTVDLSSFGTVDSLWFGLSSTDNGDFGMNTPAYFCMDNFTYFEPMSVVENSIDFKVYPNPASSELVVPQGVTSVKVFDFSGRLMLDISEVNSGKLDLTELESGLYIFQFFLNNQVIYREIIKE